MKKSIFISVLAITLFALCSFIAPLPDAQVGDKAMMFKLKNVDGQTVGLGDNAAAKGYIVVFTCNTCPVAKAYEDRVIKLHDKFASKGYPVIAINANYAEASPGDSYDLMKQRASVMKYKFPYLYDETQEVTKTYGARNTPTIFVVKKSGNDFIIAYKGAIDNNSQEPSEATEKYVESAVTALLDGKAVAVPSTKAIGCGVKWKRA